jgi:hypothetical protein
MWSTSCHVTHSLGASNTHSHRRAATPSDRLRRYGIDIEYRWIPSHIGIHGNEAADAAAKRAASHQCDDSDRCVARRCHAVEWASLAYIHRLATETQSPITKEWIQTKLSKSRSYKPKQKWGIRKALKTIPKRRAAVFLQLASGNALIGTHRTRIKKKESDILHPPLEI